MAKVFISFRNGDAPFAAAMIFRELRQRYGAGRLFRSSESITPGAWWEETIWENHRDSAVLIAVIGPRWLTVTDDQGRPKLHQEADWVRAEIAMALKQRKLVIPVLLEGAQRLTEADLPDDLAELVCLQTVPMTHRRIDATIDMLVAEISKVIEPVRPAADRDDDTPSTGQWLAVWNVPQRGGDVVDRESLMRTVRADVAAARDRRPVVLHGDVGSGKTWLAVEYAHRYAGEYQFAWWISGSRPELITADLASLARASGFNPGSDIVASLSALFSQLRRQGRWLLIFDDVDDPRRLMPYLPAIGAGGDVIVTSRNGDWGLAAAPLRVGCFDRTESITLLSRLLRDTSESLDRLATALDDIPLAVAQAAAFLNGAPLSIAGYLDLLRTRTRELLNRGETYRYAQPLAAAWSIGLERMAAEAPDAAELLELVSVLAAVPVPLEVFSCGAAALTPLLARAAGDPIAFADLVRTVARSGLVRVDRSSLHPQALLQAFIRQGFDDDRLELLRISGRAALASVPRADPRLPEAWTAYAALLPHVFALDMVNSDDPACQRLLLDTVHHLVVQANTGTARQLVTAALQRWRERQGPDADSVLDAAGGLAQALFRLGDHRGAQALDAEVLARRRRRFGDEDPETLRAAHNLAMDQWATGDVLAARTLLDQVISDRRHTLGEDHPDTLRSVHNLALMLRATGHVDAARDLDEETYRRLRALLGEDHPDTLRSGYAFALDLRALGHRERARTVGGEVYERARTTLGADHPDTLRSAYGHAVDLRLAGDLVGARNVADDTYQRRRRVLGELHVDTLRSAYLLGLIRSENGDPGGRELLDYGAGRLAALGRGDANSLSR